MATKAVRLEMGASTHFGPGLSPGIGQPGVAPGLASASDAFTPVASLQRGDAPCYQEFVALTRCLQGWGESSCYKEYQALFSCLKAHGIDWHWRS